MYFIKMALILESTQWNWIILVNFNEEKIAFFVNLPEWNCIHRKFILFLLNIIALNFCVFKIGQYSVHCTDATDREKKQPSLLWYTSSLHWFGSLWFQRNHFHMLF